MARHNIHHVPVLDGQRVAGMITSHRPDRTAQHLGRVPGRRHLQAAHGGRLVAAAAHQAAAANLAAAEASAYSTGHIVTAITDALTARLLQLGEPSSARAGGLRLGGRRLAGAQRTDRQERPGQLPGAGRRLRRKAARRVLPSLARFVNDGLNDCGYVYCPGEMMADRRMAPAQQRWAEYFRRWTTNPSRRP
jgi:CBS domain-containing protein